MRSDNKPVIDGVVRRRKASRQVFAGLIVPLIMASVGVRATSILPASSSTSSCASGQLGVVEGSSSCSQTDGNGYNNLTVAEVPFAGLTANAAVSGGVMDSFGAFGALNYSFEVIGGNAGDQVPVLIFTNLYASVSGGAGDGYAFAETLASTDLASNVGEVACLSTDGSCPESAPNTVSGVFSINAISGSIGSIHLEVDVSASPVLAAGESATASADPFIYIDPNFAGASNYNIVLSPGVANATSTTPEPGTAILVCCGGLFVLMRRGFFHRR